MLASASRSSASACRSSTYRQAESSRSAHLELQCACCSRPRRLLVAYTRLQALVLGRIRATSHDAGHTVSKHFVRGGRLAALQLAVCTHLHLTQPHLQGLMHAGCEPCEMPGDGPKAAKGEGALHAACIASS